MAIKVPVIISYNDKGAKQATKSVSKLGKSFKSLGLSSKLGYAAAGAAATAFAKKSLGAAMADEKAQATLARTLKNVGESFATGSVNKYIDGLQRATGVSEDLLRPAFTKLVTATQSAAKAQDLLALSLDVSAGTGKSAETVSAALSKAYLGQNTALGKLGVGISKADLASMSFEEITAKLGTLFAGQASTSAATFSGQMNILSVAANEASETIGVALLDSIIKLGGEKGAQGLATDMQKLADNTSNVIAGISVVIDYFKQLESAMPSWLKTTIGFLERFSPLGQAKEALKILGDLGKKEKALEQQRKNNNSDRGNVARGAVIADTAAKKLLETNKKITGEKKKQSAADKLKAIFDMDLIQLEAAKKGKLSAEDLARVNALIAIKTAGNTDDLNALKALEAAQKANAEAEIARQNEIVAVHKKNAAEILADNKAKAKEYADFVNSFTYPGGLFAGTPLAPKAPTATPGAIPEGDRFDVSMNTNFNTNTALNTPDLIDAMTPRGAAAQVAPSVTVNLQNGINIGTTAEFYESVWRAIENSNTYGNSLNRAGTG
jgi:hypothetical protein